MPEITKISHGLTIGDLKYGNARPGVVEATLKPGETMEQALDELDERLNSWHRKRYPNLYEDKEPWIPGSEFPEHMKTKITFGQPPTIQTEKAEPGDILHLIRTASTLEVLKTFKLISSGGGPYYDAYCTRIKELSNP